MSNDDCKPTCPCKARNADDAVERAIRMVGNNAEAVLAVLRNNGWQMRKR